MRLIDADNIVNYQIKGKINGLSDECAATMILLPIKNISEIPTATKYFTNEEYLVLKTAIWYYGDFLSKYEKTNTKERDAICSLLNKISILQYGYKESL